MQIVVFQEIGTLSGLIILSTTSNRVIIERSDKKRGKDNLSALRFHEHCVAVCDFENKKASAEPSISPHTTKTSVHDIDMLFNNCFESQVTRCTFSENTRTSVDLRDISPLILLN